MKILVTGGTGFLGKALAYRLHKEKHQVYVVGRNKEIGQKLQEDGMVFIEADLADQKRIIKACEGKDMVFHCGALSSPWGDYQDFYQANVKGTQHVISGVKTHGVKRLIYVSTPSIYFSYQERLDVRENELVAPPFMNHYAETKYRAEQEIKQAYKNKVPVISIRPRALFGPGDTTIFPRLMKANEKGMIPLVNNGQHVMDITYIDNVVEALLLCMNADSSCLGEFYNITNGEPVVFKEVMEQLFTLYEKPIQWKRVSYPLAKWAAFLMEKISMVRGGNQEPILTQYTVTVLSKSQTLNIEKAKRELGYQPKISVEEGLRHFITWWKEKEQ